MFPTPVTWIVITWPGATDTGENALYPLPTTTALLWAKTNPAHATNTAGSFMNGSSNV